MIQAIGTPTVAAAQATSTARRRRRRATDARTARERATALATFRLVGARLLLLSFKLKTPAARQGSNRRE
jgi:hypothetical protein